MIWRGNEKSPLSKNWRGAGGEVIYPIIPLGLLDLVLYR